MGGLPADTMLSRLLATEGNAGREEEEPASSGDESVPSLNSDSVSVSLQTGKVK